MSENAENASPQASPHLNFSVTGEALSPWDMNTPTNGNTSGTTAANHSTVRDLQAQLTHGSTALKKANMIIRVLRNEKKQQGEKMIELINKQAGMMAAIEQQRGEAGSLVGNLSAVNESVMRFKNEKDMALIASKDIGRKMEAVKELLVREKDKGAVLRYELREARLLTDKVEEEKRTVEALVREIRTTAGPNKDKAETLTRANLELSGTMAALESEVRASRNEVGALRQELMVKSETATVLSAQLEAIQAKGTVVSHSDMGRYRLLQQDLARVRLRYADLEKSLDAHNEMLGEEGRVKNELRVAHGRLAVQNDKLLSQVRGLEGELDKEKKSKQDLIAEHALNSSAKPKRKAAKSPNPNLTRGEKFEASLQLADMSDKTSRMKDTLAIMAGERMDFEQTMKKERTKRKQHEQGMQMLGTKINFLKLEASEMKAKIAELVGDKEIVVKELKSQREQNLTLHKRLGEIFDPTNTDNILNTTADLNKFNNDKGDPRSVLERAVFEWNVLHSTDSDSPSRPQVEAPVFEARYLTDRDFHRTSTSLSGAKRDPFYDIVMRNEHNKALESVGEEMMQRFQMKQFMHSAQRQRDPEKMWGNFSEKVAFVMTMAAGVEMEAARMCSEVRMSCADLAAKLHVIAEEFKVAGVKCEQERLGKHKTVLKYVQEALKNGEAAPVKKGVPWDDDENDADRDEAGRVTVSLADSSLDDETCHGVAIFISTTDSSCKDDWVSQEAFARLQNLKTVDGLVLRDNFLSDVSAESLCGIITASQSLRLLDLRGNAISKKGVEKLREAALMNRCIDRVEYKNDEGVLVCHRDSAVAVDLQPLIIDVRHNDVDKLQEVLFISPESVTLLLEKIDKIGAGGDKGWTGGGNVKRLAKTMAAERDGNRTLKTKGSYKKHIAKRGVKEAGGFGTDFIDYALTAPPKHMPLVKTSDFLSSNGNGEGGGRVTGGPLGKGKKGGELPTWATAPIRRDGAGGGDDEDSLAVSAAAASDAAPGERELGTLLDKKIKFMERNVKAKNLRPQSAVGKKGGAGGGGDKGMKRPKSATIRRLPPKR